MIGTSVDTRAFTEIANDERFRAEPPRNTSLLISDSVDITRTNGGTSVEPAEIEMAGRVPAVEHTLEEMVSRCRAAVLKYPSSLRAHMNLGLALVRSSCVVEGIEELQSAVSLDENDYVAVSSLAAAHFNVGNFIDAEKLYKQMAANFANNVAGYMGLASISMKKNDLTTASSFLEAALRLDPNLASASFLLAVVQFKLDRPRKAVSILRTALKDDARSPELNHGLAIAYLLAGEPQRAERFFQIALSLNPKLSSALHGLALLFIQQKRPDEVVELLSRSLERNPNDLEAREMLAQALILKGQYRQGRNHLNSVLHDLTLLPVQDQEEIARIQNNLGYCFALEGLYVEAESKIVDSINSAPARGPIPFENLARIYFLQGKIERALYSIDRSLGRGLRSSQLIMLKEVCLVNLGRYEEAITEMLRLVSERDAPAAAFAELGWLFCEWRSDYPTAIAVLQKGLDIWSNDVLIINNLAYAHLMNGELGAAHSLLQVARDDKKNTAYLTATRGLLALREGNFEMGESLYREAEDVASQSGNRELMFAIRKKKFLEMARTFQKQGDVVKAMKFVELGRLVKLDSKRFPVENQLASLEREISGSHLLEGRSSV